MNITIDGIPAEKVFGRPIAYRVSDLEATFESMVAGAGYRMSDPDGATDPEDGFIFTIDRGAARDLRDGVEFNACYERGIESGDVGEPGVANSKNATSERFIAETINDIEGRLETYLVLTFEGEPRRLTDYECSDDAVELVEHMLRLYGDSPAMLIERCFPHFIPNAAKTHTD